MGYTPSELESIDAKMRHRMHDRHRGNWSYCHDCWKWAEREFLLSRLMQRLDMSNA